LLLGAPQSQAGNIHRPITRPPPRRVCGCGPGWQEGATENARPENAGLENDGQLRKESQGLENAGLENDGQHFSKL